MEDWKRRQRAKARGKILATCPVCKGTGKIPKEFPFRANPKAPATHADRLGLQTCPTCQGSGRVGVE